MGSFKRAGNRSMPETGRERGSKQRSVVSDTKIYDLSEGGSCITYETKSKG